MGHGSCAGFRIGGVRCGGIGGIDGYGAGIYGSLRVDWGGEWGVKG